ncbi:hypothetical protein HRbin01_00782 [archaeon HR01]|nr:hypothetical protein HRbin01_00782 [archaeon HR01]
MLPRPLRIKLYEDVLKLRQRGLTYRNIIDEIYRVHQVRMNKSHISRWLRGLHSPYNGIHTPFLKPSENLSYIIGVVAGDGCVWRRSKPRKGYRDCLVGMEVKDRDFAEEFSRRLAVVLGREPPRPRLKKDGKWVVSVMSAVLYQLLKKPVDIRKIKPFVEYSDECIAMFLRGFFDSEGSVFKEGTIRVYNTDYRLLCYTIKLLERLGIETTKQPKLLLPAGTVHRDHTTGKLYKRRKDYYYFRISRRSNQRFYKTIGFSIMRKKQRLEDYLRRRIQPTTPFLSSI